MTKEQMMCLGQIKSLSSPRCELKAQGAVQHTNLQGWVYYHSAIQLPKQETEL